MRNFGIFLANLRASAGLSLEDLATLVGGSKSTLSRLENNEVPQPFKGSTRKLVLNLAEILCPSRKETERYLSLAEINRELLTEVEGFQLGFTPHVAGSPEETTNLERWEDTYKQLINQLEEQQAKLGVTKSPPYLKTKLQEYTNTLQEIQRRLNRLRNDHKVPETANVQVVPTNSTQFIEGKIVECHQSGYLSHSINSLSSRHFSHSGSTNRPDATLILGSILSKPLVGLI